MRSVWSLPALALGVLVPLCAAGGAAACDPGAVMARMVDTVQAGDAQGFATLFPRSGPLLLTTTIVAPPLSEWVSRAERERDFAARSGTYAMLFDGAGEDAFADVFAATGFAPWHRVGPTLFRPAGAGYADGRVFVRIACLPDGPAVVEIGWPAS